MKLALLFMMTFAANNLYASDAPSFFAQLLSCKDTTGEETLSLDVYVKSTGSELPNPLSTPWPAILGVTKHGGRSVLLQDASVVSTPSSSGDGSLVVKVKGDVNLILTLEARFPLTAENPSNALFWVSGSHNEEPVALNCSITGN